MLDPRRFEESLKAGGRSGLQSWHGARAALDRQGVHVRWESCACTAKAERDQGRSVRRRAVLGVEDHGAPWGQWGGQWRHQYRMTMQHGTELEGCAGCVASYEWPVCAARRFAGSALLCVCARVESHPSRWRSFRRLWLALSR